MTRVAVTRRSLALAAMAIAFLLATAAHGDVRKRTVDQNELFGPCEDSLSALDCAVKVRNENYEFGIAVKAVQAYTLDKVWLRVRRSDGSGAKDLAVLLEDVAQAELALFQFHASDVADKLSLTTDKLQADGFQVRPKIKSLGAGSGLQDKCPVLSFRYDSSSGWQWAKGSSPGEDKYKVVGKKWVALFKSKGSVNDVGCFFDQADDRQSEAA